MSRIPALTLWRPWTSCFTLPQPVAKRVENRPWTTRYRGAMFLHAGKRWDSSAFAVARRAVDSIGAAVQVGAVTVCLDVDALLSPNPADHPTGIVAVAELADICSASVGTDLLVCACGPWAFPDQHHWLFAADVQALPEPVEVSGAQGLWWPQSGVASATRAQLAEVAS